MRLVDSKCRMIMKQRNNFNVEIVSKSYLATVKWLRKKRSDNRLTIDGRRHVKQVRAIWFLKIPLIFGVFLTHGASKRNVESAYACWKMLNQHTHAEKYRTNHSISCTGPFFFQLMYADDVLTPSAYECWRSSLVVYCHKCWRPKLALAYVTISCIRAYGFDKSLSFFILDIILSVESYPNEQRTETKQTNDKKKSNFILT